jgi:hypothetical protein
VRPNWPAFASIGSHACCARPHGTGRECRFIRGQSRPEAAGAGQIPPLFRSASAEALTSASVLGSARHGPEPSLPADVTLCEATPGPGSFRDRATTDPSQRYAWVSRPSRLAQSVRVVPYGPVPLGYSRGHRYAQVETPSAGRGVDQEAVKVQGGRFIRPHRCEPSRQAASCRFSPHGPSRSHAQCRAGTFNAPHCASYNRPVERSASGKTN